MIEWVSRWLLTTAGSRCIKPVALAHLASALHHYKTSFSKVISSGFRSQGASFQVFNTIQLLLGFWICPCLSPTFLCFYSNIFFLTSSFVSVYPGSSSVCPQSTGIRYCFQPSSVSPCSSEQYSPFILQNQHHYPSHFSRHAEPCYQLSLDSITRMTCRHFNLQFSSEI